ncbi:glycosyltransferase family 4 protein [Paraburkholderia fungorum]|nr:glycosyltransferase family 4 protein [Paraburkholderia fungorum]
MKKIENILNVSQNFFIRGGSDSYFLSLGQLMSERGHNVVPFCGKSEKDLPSEWSRYFPRAPDFDSPSTADILRYHYSFAARRNLQSLLSAQKIGIAHLHIYYGKLTSSILPVLKNENIPIVQTVHDYKLLCPVYTCSRNNLPCEDCGGREYWRALTNKCNRGSYVRSALSMTEAYTSRWLGSVESIDRFIAVSQFFSNRMEANGIDSAKISVVPNFVDIARFSPAAEIGRYFIYFGRMERSKGIATLLKAFSTIPDIPLILVGEGSFLEEAKAISASMACSNITFLGFKRGEELYKLVAGAVCSILPAEAYENCPMSILEAFGLGRPVIGARIGGIPELIDHGVDGYIFNPGDVDSLREYVKEVWYGRRNSEMGRAARFKAERKFSADAHYKKICEVYEKVN